jgi:translation elongation factor EF-1beta
MVDGIESKLGDAVWLGGQQPSAEDRESFEGLNGAIPNPDTHPNAFAWYSLVARFTGDVRGSWTGAAAAGGKGGDKAKGGKAAKGGKKEEPKAAAAAADDDFDDLFDGTDDVDAEAAAAAMKAKATAAKLAKAPPVGKSLVVWDVKIIDTETDLNKLGRDVIAQINQEGLTWKTEFKLEPVAFGVKKLVIGATIIDDKVSADEVGERIENTFEGVVQSVDIAVFSKI